MNDKKQLKISDTLSLPLDAVTQTFAILAKKRRGKTYTASVMAEEMFKAGLPFVVLDPTGAWWGLRASADGKKAGYPVVIIGGDHGDIPLDPGSGTAIAELVIEHPSYYVIDLSQFHSNAEQDRFAMEFGERLYRVKNKHRFPMMLFIDEADCFMPQQPMPEQRRMLGAYDTIVRRGGIRGIGVCLISQRPAVVNKNVLSQVECLIVLQIVGPQDRDAIEKWVSSHGDRSDGEKLMSSLSALDLGEAWFWSPAWLDKFERVKIRKRETFNSSKTPEVGEQFTSPKVLAQVDLEKIRTKIAANIEKAESQDADRLFKALRTANTALTRALGQLTDKDARIQELETKLSARPASSKIERIKVPTVGLKTVERLQDSQKRLAKMCAVTRAAAAQVILAMDAVEKNQSLILSEVAALTKQQQSEKKIFVDKEIMLSFAGDKAAQVKLIGTDDKLNRLQRVLLHVLACYGPCRLARLGVLAGYAINGTVYNALSDLRTRARIVGSNQDEMSITDAGLAALGPHPKLPTDRALLHSHWINKFDKLSGDILQYLLAYPHGGTIDDISKYVGRQVNGTLYNSLSKLRTAGVLIGSNRQIMKASEHLLG